MKNKSLKDDIMNYSVEIERIMTEYNVIKSDDSSFQKGKGSIIQENFFADKIEELPSLINPHNELEYLKKKDLIKKFQDKASNKVFYQILDSNKFNKLVILLYWRIIQMKFLNFQLSGKVFENLKEKISTLYLKLFSFIPNPKEKLINGIIVVSSLIIFSGIKRNYIQEFPRYQMRFLLDILHISLHEINGNILSDIYVCNMIGKYCKTNVFEGLVETKNDILPRIVESQKLQNTKNIPSVLKLSKFNCHQISPGMSYIFRTENSLPNKPVKLIRHKIIGSIESKSLRNIPPIQPVSQITKTISDSRIKGRENFDRKDFFNKKLKEMKDFYLDMEKKRDSMANNPVIRKFIKPVDEKTEESPKENFYTNLYNKYMQRKVDSENEITKKARLNSTVRLV